MRGELLNRYVTTSADRARRREGDHYEYPVRGARRQIYSAPVVFTAIEQAFWGAMTCGALILAIAVFVRVGFSLQALLRATH